MESLDNPDSAQEVDLELSEDNEPGEAVGEASNLLH